MPQIFVWFRYISPLYWGAYILSKLSFQHQSFHGCNNPDDNNLESSSSSSASTNNNNQILKTCFMNGNQVLDLYHFNDGNLSFQYLFLGICTFCYPIMAILIYRLMAYIRSH
jgi:hypothetical protein